MKTFETEIGSHYAQTGLVKTVLEAIKESGLDIDNLNSDDLAGFDEFHIRGRLATQDLAEHAGVNDKMRVLDIGSGIGGPSRFLAENYGCRVTGIDLTPEFCELARIFAEKLDLLHLLDYHCGSATELPFEDSTFDLIWTQHTAMNIENKPKLYAEAARVLKQGGKFIIYDILAGPNQPIHFPVPWARTDDISFLATPDEMKTYLKNSGLKVINWDERTGLAREWFVATMEKLRTEGPPKISFKLFLGNDLKPMMENVLTNLEENRIKVFEIIVSK